MYPQKGVIAEGSDADIVVWNPDAKWTVTAAGQVQNVDYTPYEGMPVCGIAEKVYLHGILAADNGRVTAPGNGQFVSRGPADLSFRKQQ